MSKISKNIRKARQLYVQSEKNATYGDVAKELDVSEVTVWKYHKRDNESRNDGKTWKDLRNEYWELKNERKEQKDLVADVKKELSELLDREKSRHNQLLALDKIQQRLMQDDIFEKMSNQARIRDYLDLIKEMNKVREGLGFADKVIVIGAPKEDSIEGEFEILEDDDALQNE